ncbi:MAG: hypothetical protein HYR74_05770 [Candidatus Eisenbacteria bacterium]|nr:hypothetical protein [Candidatus Eisenbacteria bacterium]
MTLHLHSPKYSVDFRHLGRPIPECVVVELNEGPPGEPIADLGLPHLVDTLKIHFFDQAPVATGVGPIGYRVVALETLERLVAAGELLTTDDAHYQPNDRLFVEMVYVPLDALFKHFASASSALVCHAYEARRTEPEDTTLVTLQATPIISHVIEPLPLSANQVDLYGLVTLADLNRREVRRVTYDLVLDLERALAELIAGRFNEAWDWIQGLGEGSQVRILGQWTVSRRKMMQIEEVELAMLNELLTVVRRSEPLRKQLEIPAGKQGDSLIWKVTEFRNKVMHPARQLVLDQSDARKASEAIQFMAALLGRLEKTAG